MKKILNFLFGEIGLIISSIIMSILSWFLFPIFIEVVTGTHTLSNIIGYLFICPFALGFYLSSVCTSVGLICKSAKNKKWFTLTAGAIVLMFDIVILILSLT